MNISEITTWQEALLLCLLKKSFEKKTTVSRVASRRERTRAMYNRLVYADPCRGLTAEGLALHYVRLFNKQYGYGSKRKDFPSGETFQAICRYQSETLLPVISAAYFDSGAVMFVEKRCFEADGTYRIEMPSPVGEGNLMDSPEKTIHLKGFPESFPFSSQELYKEIENLRDSSYLIGSIIRSVREVSLEKIGLKRGAGFLKGV